MNSRERILKSINHEEPDRIPYDLAGSTWTGITNTAYQNLRRHLGLCPAEPDWSDVIQQIVVPSEEVLTELQVDTRGVFPLTSHNSRSLACAGNNCSCSGWQTCIDGKSFYPCSCMGKGYR